MNSSEESRVLPLSANRPVVLRRVRGMRVDCLEGVVWLTVAGVPGDTLLQPGMAYVIPANGLVLMEALPEARIRLFSPARVSIHRKIHLFLRRLRTVAGMAAGGVLALLPAGRMQH